MDLPYLPAPTVEDLTEQQKDRERSLRQAALGRRADMIERGLLGPVLKRWVNSDIVPIADNLRRVAQIYLSGDMEGVALALGTPTAELSQRERPLRSLMEWSLRGRSPGRAELSATTYAEDLALSFMGSIVPRLASSKEGALTLSAALMIGSEALRETVQGQFISSVQGAKAMQAIRERMPEKWMQRRSLQRIANQMKSQVMPAFMREQRRALAGDELEIPMRGNRKVIHVTDYKGEVRRLEFLRTPDELDWEIMSLCWQDENDAAAHPQRGVWLAFATMFLSLAQQSAGWFDVSDKFRLAAGRKRRTKMLTLSEEAHASIARDVERWVASGFLSEPMIVPPGTDGDFLTVKHRKVTGQRAPGGLQTNAEGSWHWEQAVKLSQSPWRVNEYAPAMLDPHWQDTYAEEPHRLLKLGSHKRLGSADFYLPVNLDFRGRIYYRTPWVTPQADDFGKSLLRFPPREQSPTIPADTDTHIMLHFSSLWGNDKLPILERALWWDTLTDRLAKPTVDFSKASSPNTFEAHWNQYWAMEWDSIPIQLDGTCNGLQHLSALMRDEVGAAEVNLTQGGDKPRDIYGKVAEQGLKLMERDPTDPKSMEFWLRLREAGVVLNRSLTKQPVMVLPYGGSLEAIRLSVKASVLEQLGIEEGEPVADCSPWHMVQTDGYGAFSNRPLADHPLFNEDIRLLSSLVWASIKPVIPKAMQAMATLQAIGVWVGLQGKALSWATGRMDGGSPLWVTQAKSKASRKQVTLKGYHLPDVIRRLTLLTQSNELDPRAHRTGIVANFIHSLDAEHLARTTELFYARGGTCMGAIHDCVMCRPSETALMHECLRDAFAIMYNVDPLLRPVKLISLDTKEEVVYGTWHELAQAAGVEFPEQGSWQPNEVLASQWFFS